jgi:hypothetical protein
LSERPQTSADVRRAFDPRYCLADDAEAALYDWQQQRLTRPPRSTGPRKLHLHLRKNGIGREGMEVLVASHHLRGLRFVDLALNAVESPIDQAATDNGEVVLYTTPALGRELELKHGPRSWFHWRTGDTFWDHPPWQTFAG